MWGAAAEQLRAPALATCKNDGNPANSTQRLSGTLANVRPAPARRVPSQCHHLIPQHPLAEIITTTEQHPGHWKVTATPGLRDISACYHVVRLHAMQNICRLHRILTVSIPDISSLMSWKAASRVV